MIAARRANAGFTLIELLVVMAILATLAGLGIYAVPMMMQSGKKTAVKVFLTQLDSALEAYKNSDQGAYPPTTLGDYAGVGPMTSFENCGVESVVLCLNSKNYGGSFNFENSKEVSLENLDADASQLQLTRGGDKQLWELVDPWGTPLVYLNASDYGRAADLAVVSGEGAVLKAKAWLNPKFKTYFNRDRFQIICAGPDRTFNTDDDITNFERE